MKINSLFQLLIVFFGSSSFAAMFSDIEHIPYSKAQPAIQGVMQAVAVIVTADDKRGISKLPASDDWALISVKLKDKKNGKTSFLRLCEGERFANVYRGNLVSASGVLISRNQLLVSGHSMDSEDDCAKKKFVFGFNDMTRKGSDGSFLIANQNVYGCKKIQHIRYDGNTLTSPTNLVELTDKGYIDFAIVELDRTVEGVSPAVLASPSNYGTSEDSFFMISSMMGLPVFAQRAELNQSIVVSGVPMAYGFISNSSVGSSGGIYVNSQGQIVALHSASSTSADNWDTTTSDDVNECKKWIALRTTETIQTEVIASEKRANVSGPIYSWAMPIQHVQSR